MKKLAKILGIETSCDETAAAVVKAKISSQAGVLCFELKILSNIVSSQIDIHKKYGGVYPELASRAHLENIIPVIQAALDKAKLGFNQIDAIAVTIGPGLIGSLLVGVETAKALAYSFNKPIIAINHLEGHIAANFISGNSKSEARNPKKIHNSLFIIHNSSLFPILNLIVSGGHTSLVLMKDFGEYKTLGSTRDDAAGEAFDKVAAILGLPYPGGPAIEAATTKITNSKFQIPNKSQIQNSNFQNSFKLPRPMIDSDNFDFSFSGLKTAVLRLTKKLGPAKTKKIRKQIAFEFQNAIIDVLASKTLGAAQKYQAKTIMLSGGVAANSALRQEFKVQCSRLKVKFFAPPKNLCTDNAAMIATASIFHLIKNKLIKNKKSDLFKIQAKPNQKLK